MVWSIHALRGGIGWITFAGNESGDDACRRSRVVSQAGVDALENAVDSVVPVLPDSPALNDTCVVAIEDEVVKLWKAASDGFNEKFEADGFSPCNVSFAISGLPFGKEVPGSPSLSDDDANANASASIRESVWVVEGGRWDDGE